MSIEEIILSLTALVATAVFVFSVYRHGIDRASEELRTWQSVALHSFFEDKGKEGATLQEALQWYRTEAMAYVPGVKKSELSENACRRVIISLVRDKLLEQLGQNTYRVGAVHNMIDTMSDVMAPMLSSMAPMLGDQHVSRSVFADIAAAPFSKTRDETAIDVAEKIEQPVAEVRTVIAQEIGRQRLQVDENQKVGFGPMSITGN